MWKYKGKEIQDEDILPTYVGFIYLITQVSTGKKYIGRKLLTSTRSKMINGKRRKFHKESNWREYWSSSPKIIEWIKERGTSDFTREILVFVSGKGMLAAAEEFALYACGALESDKFLNENIRSKIYANWVKPNEMENLRQVLKDNKLYL